MAEKQTDTEKTITSYIHKIILAWLENELEQVDSLVSDDVTLYYTCLLYTSDAADE